MTETFDAIEAMQHGTNVLIGRVRDALAPDTQGWLADIEARGGALKISSWTTGELAAEVIFRGEVVMIFWLVTARGVGMFASPPAEMLDAIAKSKHDD